MGNYDEKLFNKLYGKTEGLRKKLASQIDPHRFGLQYEDILSFFDTKFIFTFHKYHEKFEEDVLLGHLINSLSFFKCRILRAAYTEKFSQSFINEEAVIEVEHRLVDYQPVESNANIYYEKLMNFMKANLSDNAFIIFEAQLNPPHYIISRINTQPDANLRKIPDQLFLEYFGLGNSDKSYKFLNAIRKEIRNATNYAKMQFKNTLTT